MLDRLKARLVEKAVDIKLRRVLSPETVGDIIDDLLALLKNGVGHVGLDERIIDYVESMIDKDELAATLSARLLHYLGTK
jgi:hypothetical protein